MILRTLSIQSKHSTEFIDVTADLNNLIKKEGILEGYCIIFIPHTTAAVTINEGADSDVKSDINHMLSRLIPKKGPYDHSEGNSDAHIKASLLGSSEYILIKDGRLLLGTWQHVYFFEGDGPRTRKMYIHITCEDADKL